METEIMDVETGNQKLGLTVLEFRHLCDRLEALSGNLITVGSRPAQVRLKLMRAYSAGQPGEIAAMVKISREVLAAAILRGDLSKDENHPQG